MNASCPRCGRPKVHGGRATRYLYCPPCSREKAARRRRRPETAAADLSGARERLGAYLEARGQAALDAIYTLCERNVGYGRTS